MVTFSIKSFFLWTPFSSMDCHKNTSLLVQPEDWEIPAPDFIDKKKQRRLNELSKLVLHSAIKCSAPENRNYVTVLSSRNGDINNALIILQEIAKDELISPQMFVNSVLNMPYAHYSIFFGNSLPSSAISSSESTLGYGFLEAVLNLKRFPGNDILLTCADLPLEEDLKVFAYTPYLPYSLSMIISDENSTRNMVSFNYEIHHSNNRRNQTPDALYFYYQFLNGDGDFFTSETSDSRFTWKKHI